MKNLSSNWQKAILSCCIGASFCACSSSRPTEISDDILYQKWTEEFLSEDIVLDENDKANIEITRQDLDNDGINEIIMHENGTSGIVSILVLTQADNDLQVILCDTSFPHGAYELCGESAIRYSNHDEVVEGKDMMIPIYSYEIYTKVKDSRLDYSITVMTTIKEDVDPAEILAENYDQSVDVAYQLTQNGIIKDITAQEAEAMLPEAFKTNK